jgi:histidinol-phosphate aminotransferase
MSYTRPESGAGLRLHLNEHTGGCSPAVLEALRGLTREAIACYADAAPATEDAARYLGVEPAWLRLLNGLDEGLHAAAFAASVRSGADFDGVIVEPAFEMYAAVIEAAGGRVVRASLDAGLRFDTAAVRAALTARTRLVFVCAPNNPAGSPVSIDAIEALAAAAPAATVFVDEAYAEFSGRTAIGALLDRRRNVVVGRTFAKAHGLAGLRIGALVAHPDTLAPLGRMLGPFNVNVAALVALQAALADPEYLRRSVADAADSRARIAEFCRTTGLETWPSEANFVLMRVGPTAPAIVRAMAAEGVLVRDRSSLPGCDGCIRVTAGPVDHTRRGLAALDAARRSIGGRR